MTPAAAEPARNKRPKATHELVLSAEEWARTIKGAWQKSVTAIFEAGDLLREAKKKLRHGKFERMVAELLPFSQRTAQKLMEVSRCRYLRENVEMLPASWTTLYVLTGLGKVTFNAALERGAIYPDMDRAEAESLTPQEQQRHPRPTAVESAAAVEVKGESIAGAETAADYKPTYLAGSMRTLAEMGDCIDLCFFAARCSSEVRESLLRDIPMVVEWLSRLQGRVGEGHAMTLLDPYIAMARAMCSTDSTVGDQIRASK